MLLTPDDVPDAAVQIAESVLPLVARSGEIAIVRATVAALARAGWLTPPDRRAALEAVAAAATALADEPDRSKFEDHLRVLEERVAALDALDAAPAATTAEDGAAS